MKRPHILWIMTDQQRWDTIAANGNHHIKTPNLDRLAREGTNFDHCFAQNPVCMPSRISMMTGQYCSALNITHMAVTVPEKTLTIQKILKHYGYYNALIGKLHYLPHSNRDHRDLHPLYDFDHMELSDEPGCYEDAYRAWVRRKAPEQIDNISLGLPPVTQHWQRITGYKDGIKHPEREKKAAIPFKADSHLTHTAFVGEQTIEFLNKSHNQPFFCFTSFYSPHSPWVAPQEFLDLYDPDTLPIAQFPLEMAQQRKEEAFSEQELRSVTQGYYAMISEVDSWIGKILDTLEARGLIDETIIVFCSDHGEWLGEHLKYGKGFWAPDVVSRVPLIVRVPSSLNGANGRHVTDIVENVDIVPTLLNLASIQIPADVQGDLLPVTSDHSNSEGDGLALTEYHGWKSLRLSSFRYVLSANGSERLYDLNKDPMEYDNLVDVEAYREYLHEARFALLKRMLRIEQPLKREWAY
jgi:arylsulfatase A-like enzyme